MNLLDLKTRKVKHGDIGQMNLYLNYFKEEENTEGDSEPIGIIIAADKHEYLVKYATEDFQIKSLFPNTSFTCQKENYWNKK